MIKTLFGFGEDDSKPLVNEPTIDYDKTIPISTPRRQPQTRYQTPLRSIVDYSKYQKEFEFSDEDEDLMNDFSMIKDLTQEIQETRNVSKFSLPENYPGKFPSTPKNNRSQNENGRYTSSYLSRKYGKDNSQFISNGYVKDESVRFNKQPQTSTHRNSAPNTVQTDSKPYMEETQEDPLHEPTIERKLGKLQIEVDEEFKQNSTSRNSSKRDPLLELKELRQELKSLNGFLERLSEFVGLYEEELEENDNLIIPHDIMERFDALESENQKQEELLLMLYPMLIRVQQRYNEYRKSHPYAKKKIPTSIGKPIVSIRETAKLIDSKCKDESIKTECGKILSDLPRIEEEQARLQNENDQLRKEKEAIENELNELKKFKEAAQKARS